MEDQTNMSMRKFLKQVGVTSQKAIEAAIAEAGDTSGKTFKAKMVLTIEEVGLTHEVTGEIEG
ncbi:MAG: DUF6494 family protein [Aliishimia sp.]